MLSSSEVTLITCLSSSAVMYGTTTLSLYLSLATGHNTLWLSFLVIHCFSISVT